MKNSDITAVYDILSDTYLVFEETDDESMNEGLSSTPFRALVSVALSTMTTGPRTIKAALALYEKVTTVEELAEIDDDDLRERIRSVAHYNRKTVNLKTMARQIVERHDGQVPETREELLALTGIGRKCTDIMMNFQFDEPSIAVDTHVHRVVTRLGMVSDGTAEAVADELNAVTPAEYKAHAHEWLIQHGMKVCVSRRPKCQSCPLQGLCAYPAESRSA
ncbi:DNA lyase [Rhodococcus sp. EPR-157]|uniref:endonuclease III domain-containing protein n=1 Tax=Rhodococcus sp. EPR-157 TaxID=1813677 RepID=UPI0007BC57B6|nr:endonuclease III [Rhodococcus sp. EPR-157]KZF12595.1 DNA lyase [Rhodococcus sp. EPR-157]